MATNQSIWLILAASQLACATMDALTPASARFFGRSNRHELRSLTRRQVSHVCRLSLRTPFYHPTSPSSDLVPLLTDLASHIPSSLANLPGRIVFTCLADWVSRTRLLQTMPHGIALTLCFLFFHGLTMQDFHLR